MAGTHWVHPGTHFFSDPPFQNLGLKVVPQQKGVGGGGRGGRELILLYFIAIYNRKIDINHTVNTQEIILLLKSEKQSIVIA